MKCQRGTYYFHSDRVSSTRPDSRREFTDHAFYVDQAINCMLAV
jgi:hypothetical protein